MDIAEIDWKSFPTTVREYYNNSYKFEQLAKVLAIKQLQGPKAIILLDKTIFHPQGGGQPRDDGIIKSATSTFRVNDLKIEDNRILHYGEFEEGGEAFKQEEEVHLNIDSNQRKLFARVHSAGHLLDIAMKKVGFMNKPGKGYHFATGAYVEYIGKMNQEQRDKVMAELQNQANKIIEDCKEEDKVWSKMCTYEQGKEALGEVPPYIGEGQEFRVVKLTPEDEGCPCGGTHVQHVKDIKSMKISKVQNKGKNVRVSYQVAKLQE